MSLRATARIPNYHSESLGPIINAFPCLQLRGQHISWASKHVLVLDFLYSYCHSKCFRGDEA